MFIYQRVTIASFHAAMRPGFLMWRFQFLFLCNLLWLSCHQGIVIATPQNIIKIGHAGILRKNIKIYQKII